MGILSRRLFLWSGASLALPATVLPKSKNEQVYLFTTADCDVRMTVEFYDRYASQGFWFEDRFSGRDYCLSAKGEEQRNCLANFTGSLAVARYRIRQRSKSHDVPVLREYVRTIDQDARLQTRPPFERTMELKQGIASDIQAFGYEETASPSNTRRGPEPHGPWCFLRQDLYLREQPAPFLVVYWKHALSAIRILDIIPGDQTWPMQK